MLRRKAGRDLCEFGRRVAFAAALALSLPGAGIAVAKACPQGADIKEIEYAEGSKVHVLERTRGRLIYESTTPGGKKARVTTSHGLITLSAETEFETSEFTWDIDPATFTPQKIGETWFGKATIKSSKGTEQTFASEVSAVAAETVKVADCDYEVTKLEVVNTINDSKTYVTRYYHAPSALTLRTVISIRTSEGVAKTVSEFVAVDVK